MKMQVKNLAGAETSPVTEAVPASAEKITTSKRSPAVL